MYEGDIAQALIAAGSDGLRMASLMKRFQSRVSHTEMEDMLDAWIKEGKVQMFVVNKRHRVYRATTKMLEK
jgi:hypothetical protein